MPHRRAMLTPLAGCSWFSECASRTGRCREPQSRLGSRGWTVYKWLRRYQTECMAGLDDRSSRPRSSPRQTSAREVAAVLQLRRRRRWGPHRIGPALGIPRSTVYAVLCRQGESRLSDQDRSTGLRIRYVRENPGELLHLDVKKLGRNSRGRRTCLARGPGAGPSRGRL